MLTYLLLNLIFLLPVAFIFIWFRKILSLKAAALTLGALVILTVIFDNAIIGAGIVAYDETKLLGLYVFMAPVEDFFYTFLAVMIVPVMWHLFHKRNND